MGYCAFRIASKQGCQESIELLFDLRFKLIFRLRSVIELSEVLVGLTQHLQKPNVSSRIERHP